MKHHFKYALFYVFCFTNFSHANTGYILIDGGPDEDSNYISFYNGIRRSYEVVKSKGENFKLLAKDGTWKVSDENKAKLSDFSLTTEGRSVSNLPKNNTPVYPPIDSPASGLDDIERSITDLKSQGNSSILIYLTSHGGPPASKHDLETGKFMLWDNEYKYSELRDFIAKYPELKFKIANGACFSGAIHSISRDLPNVCTAATAPYFNPTAIGDLYEEHFDRAFWKKMENSDVSFAEASLEGFREAEVANPNQGRLSSFDFVEYTLQKGIYEKKWSLRGRGLNNRRKDTDKNPVGSLIDLPDNFVSYLPADHNLVQSYFNWNSPDEITSMNFSCDTKKFLPEISPDLNKMHTIISGITDSIYKQIADNSHPRLKTIFHNAIEDMNKNGEKYYKILQRYNDRFTDLRLEWEEEKKKQGIVEKKEKNENILSRDEIFEMMNDPEKVDDVLEYFLKMKVGGENNKQEELKKETGKRGELREQFDKLKEEAQKDLKAFSFSINTLKKLEALEEFNQVATAEQKKKFLDLLDCEWEKL